MVRQHGKLGRNTPYSSTERPRLKLEAYLDTSSLPNVRGVTVDWATKVPSWPMYLNDQIGDCTCAAVGHIIEAQTAYSSREFSVTDSEVLSMYEAVGHYVPGDPSTDNGAVMQDVLQYWHDTGIAGHKIDSFASIGEFNNVWLLKQALEIFGTVYIGINCPQSALDQFNAGEVWSYVPGSPIAGGHAVPIQRQYPVGEVYGIIDVVTWGEIHPMTIKFAKNYIEEAWVVIDNDWIEANGTAPNGLNLRELQADFRTITSSGLSYHNWTIRPRS